MHYECRQTAVKKGTWLLWIVRYVNWKNLYDTLERGRSMKLGTVLSFVLKPKFEGDTLESHETASVSTFLQKIFFRKIYINYISFNSKLNAGKGLQQNYGLKNPWILRSKNCSYLAIFLMSRFPHIQNIKCSC